MPTFFDSRCNLIRLRRETTVVQRSLNTTNLGYGALRSYCEELRERYQGAWISSRYGKDAARRGALGQGYDRFLPNLRPFAFAQLDYQVVDAASIILIRNEQGVELEIPLARWYYGLIVEERFGAILGICIALEVNPSGDTVLETIESALRPVVYSAEDPRFTYATDGKILLHDFLPEIAYQTFAVLKIDNAWCNAATEVLNNIIDTVGCAVNFGPVGGWWRRDLVEQTFGQFTRKGLQRLPSTYGSGPQDTKADDPNGKAIRFRIALSEIVEILYGVARNHNTTPTERLQWASPLEATRAALAREGSGFFSQPIPRVVQQDMKLMKHARECVVRGNIKKHQRPYFKADRCRYTNQVLSNAYRLVGKKIVVYFDRRDPNIAHATVKETGEQLGRMHAERKWAQSKCSLRMRQLINRSGLARAMAHESCDPVGEWSAKKAKQLRERKKSKRKSPSKDALAMAKAALAEKTASIASDERATPPKLSLASCAFRHQHPFDDDENVVLRPVYRRSQK